MKKSKQLYEYLNWFDHFNLWQIASRIADYKEKKHIDDREITNNEYWRLAEQYVNDNEMYLEDEEYTWKWIIEEFKTQEKQKKLKSLIEEINNTYWEINEDRFRKYMIDKIYNCRNITYHEAETIYEYCCFNS